eukprot:926940-Pyramimonas_sp.AAC.1
MRPNQADYRAESIHASQRAPRQTRRTRLRVGDFALQALHGECQMHVVSGGLTGLRPFWLPQAAVRVP